MTPPEKHKIAELRGFYQLYPRNPQNLTQFAFYILCLSVPFEKGQGFGGHVIQFHV